MPHWRTPRDPDDGWDQLAGFAMVMVLMAFAIFMLSRVGLF